MQKYLASDKNFLWLSNHFHFISLFHFASLNSSINPCVERRVVELGIFPFLPRHGGSSYDRTQNIRGLCTPCLFRARSSPRLASRKLQSVLKFLGKFNKKVLAVNIVKNLTSDVLQRVNRGRWGSSFIDICAESSNDLRKSS